jgi:hypothetical protein
VDPDGPLVGEAAEVPISTMSAASFLCNLIRLGRPSVVELLCEARRQLSMSRRRWTLRASPVAASMVSTSLSNSGSAAPARAVPTCPASGR